MTRLLNAVLPGLLGAGIALLVPAPADAQTSVSLSPDPTSIWTIQNENASISTASTTDRYYTNGLRLGWTSGTDAVPDFLAGVGRTLWGDGQERISFDLSQQIYNPLHTHVSQPPPGDTPYAGVLLGTFSLQQDSSDSRSVLALSLGVIGPAALGKQVQNGFHDLIGQEHPAGWDTQLKNEPAFQLVSGRTWRLPMGTVAGLETDALPELTANVGSVWIYAETGARFRIGRGLDSDFGPARVRPGNSGGDAFRPTRPFVWYVFAGADGQVVAHDETVQGSNWHNDSPGANLRTLVGEMEVGLAVMMYGTRLTYTQVFDTQRAEHQKGGLHQFGSLALSVRF